MGGGGVGVDRAVGAGTNRPCVAIVPGGKGGPQLYKLQVNRQQLVTDDLFSGYDEL